MSVPGLKIKNFQFQLVTCVKDYRTFTVTTLNTLRNVVTTSINVINCYANEIIYSIVIVMQMKLFIV